MLPKSKAASPWMAGRPEETASQTHSHNNLFRRKNKEIDWWLAGIIGATTALNIVFGLALALIGRAGL